MAGYVPHCYYIIDRSRVVARADIIATDKHAQFLHHGDFSAAVRAGPVAKGAEVSFYDVLANLAVEAPSL